MHSSGGDSDDTNTKSGVHKRFIQVAAFVVGHATILSGLTVEDEVSRQDSAADDGRTVQESLGHVTTLGSIVCRLHICTAEGILEGLSGLCEDGRGKRAERLRLSRLEWRVVDKSSRVGRFRDLTKRRSDGERPSHKERHGCGENDDVDGRQRATREKEEEYLKVISVGVSGMSVYGGPNVREAQCLAD